MRRNRWSKVFLTGALLLLGAGCGKRGEERGWPDLMLAQAQFSKKRGEDGKEGPVPGPARLIFLYQKNSEWSSEILEDPESNVFHKALFFKPINGEEGILTIGGNKAALKLWRRRGRKWEATTLWKTSFGGTQNRLRDMEIGDVTGDDVPDIVIATHDQGVVAVLEQKGREYVVHELCRKPQSFVHEIEIGDVDGDGLKEIFATPSAPNKLDGSIQPGKIIMFKYNLKEKVFTQKVVQEFPRCHVKEILCRALNSSGRPILLASLESENVGGEPLPTDSTRIKLYHFQDEKISSREVVALPGQLCRFLTMGDVDGDGKEEVIASTQNSGIWMLRPDGKTWERSLIDDASSGFEHATLIADIDRDGQKEIYVAADDQHSFNRYKWDGRDFKKEKILKLEGDCITFNISPGPGIED